MEIITYYQEEYERYIIHVINAQEQVPNLLLNNIIIKLRTKGKRPAGIFILPDKSPVDFDVVGEYTEFTIHELEIYHMIEVSI